MGKMSSTQSLVGDTATRSNHVNHHPAGTLEDLEMRILNAEEELQRLRSRKDMLQQVQNRVPVTTTKLANNMRTMLAKMSEIVPYSPFRNVRQVRAHQTTQTNSSTTHLCKFSVNLQALPTEIVRRIEAHLDNPVDRVCFKLTCKRFHRKISLSARDLDRCKRWLILCRLQQGFLACQRRQDAGSPALRVLQMSSSAQKFWPPEECLCSGSIS